MLARGTTPGTPDVRGSAPHAPTARLAAHVRVDVFRGRGGYPDVVRRTVLGRYEAKSAAFGISAPRLRGMSAQPIEEHDPRDPQVIFHALPECERREFLRQYHDAVNIAHDPAGYK